MERRKVLSAAATVAATWPVGVRPQTRVRRIGVLALSPDYPQFDEWRAFADEMARRGYREGREVEYVHRASGVLTEPEMSRRLRQSVDELLRMKIDVLYVVEGDAAVRGLRAATVPVPVVVDRFYFDPVERGHVASLAGPGGNITGNAVLNEQMEAKMVEFLLQATGTQAVVGYLDIAHLVTWPMYPRVLQQRRDLGRALAFTPVVETLEQFDHLGAKLDRMRREGVRAVKFDDPEFFSDRRREVASAFAVRRLAAISNEPAYTKAGLLLTFGWDAEDIANRSAAYVDRILRGARPHDLPVEQAARFKLGVNRATARAIGIQLPSAVLARADELVG